MGKVMPNMPPWTWVFWICGPVVVCLQIVSLKKKSSL